MIDGRNQILDWLRADSLRWEALAAVRALALPQGCIAAGFVRDMVWSHLHGHAVNMPDDVDVVWFDAAQMDADVDKSIEDQLRQTMPNVPWSVKNQARMHHRNGDRPYTSVSHAMQHWPETATAIAVQRAANDECTVVAPFGLKDLMTLILSPTPEFVRRKRAIFDARVTDKRWLTRYPKLRLENA